MRWPKTTKAGPVAGTQRLRWLLLLCGWLLTALAGCATSSNSTFVVVTATPCVPLTPMGGTRTCGNIVITTDRAVYAPQDGVQLTVTSQMPGYNHPVSVILTAAQGCPIARAQRLAGSVWEDVPLCRSSAAGGSTSQPGTRQITVAAGKSYTETITLAAEGRGTNAASPAPFPTGLYQLVVHYALVASSGTTSVTLDGDGGFVASSQPFRVCTAGVCP